MSDIGSSQDHAKRAYDIMQLHIMGKGDEAWGKWVAFRLSDGGSDNTLYDSRDAAVSHQIHPLQSCYLVIPPTGFTYTEIREFLDLSRRLYDERIANGKGGRIPSHGDYMSKGFRL